MDFGQRISDAKKQSNASMGTYKKYDKQAGSAYKDYNSAFDQRQDYGDIYGAARDEYMNTDEINAARGTYQGARDAVDQMNTTMNKMPESIRQQYGGTGLTEAQRARAMQDQYAANANTHNMLNTNYQNASADYNDLASRAMQEVFNVAGGNYQGQQDQLGLLQSAWSTLLNQANNAYSANQGDRQLLQGQYGARDDWTMREKQMELERWKEQQANARSAADRASQMDLQKYLAASNGRIAGMNKPSAPDYGKIAAPKNNSRGGFMDSYVNGADNWGKNISQGWQNVKDFGPLALFGGGSLWGR